MGYGTGARSRLIHCVETVEGTTPIAPSWKTLRRTTGGSGITISRQTLESSELRADRQSAIPGLGNKGIAVNVPLEFSFDSFDDFLESILASAFAVAYSLTALVVTVAAAAKTFTRATGSWITDGVKVGDHVTFGGFTDAGNNATFIVTAVSALVLTCAAASGLVNVSADDGVTATTTRKVMSNGVARKTFTMEEGFLDLDTPLYQVARGVIANKFALSIKNNAKVTGSFDLLGLSSEDLAEASIAASVADPTDTDVFDSFTGSILEGGTAFEAAQSLDLSVDASGSHKYALYHDDPAFNSLGRIKITGTLTSFFKDAVLANKFLNKTPSSIAWTLTDGDGNSYLITLPHIVYTGASHTVPEDDIPLSLPFTAGVDPTTGKMISIERIPA